jgi:type VI secretion system protein VasI
MIGRGVLAFALLSVPSLAEESVANECHLIARADHRLACYDKQTGFSPASALPTAPLPEPASMAPKGAWQFASETSELDGRIDVWLSLRSENMQPNQIGNNEHATLWVRCMGNSTNAFVTFNDYTSDDQNVKYRLDDGKVTSLWMQTMNGGEGLGLWSGSKAISFIKGLYDKNRMVIAYSSYNNHNLEFIFPVTGLRSQIDKLADACGWEP